MLLIISFFVMVILGLLYVFVFRPVQCLVKGDKWQKAGLAGAYMCIHTYSDGGKACKSSEECEGDCFVPFGGESADQDQCEYNDSPFICHSKIEDCRIVNGKRECQGRCVD